MSKFKAGDVVRIKNSSVHEHIGLTATVSRTYTGSCRGDYIVYFGDQDEDEFIYDESELVIADPGDIAPSDYWRMRTTLERIE